MKPDLSVDIVQEKGFSAINLKINFDGRTGLQFGNEAYGKSIKKYIQHIESLG